MNFALPDFIVGSANRHAMTLTLARTQGVNFRFLYLHGPSGCGKTHLLRGMTHELRLQGKVVEYVSGEAWVRGFVHSVRNHDLAKRRFESQSHDLLVIDGLDAFAGLWGAQEELWNTILLGIENGKSFVFSGPLRPTALVNMDSKIIQAMGMGQESEIFSSGPEMRGKIIVELMTRLGYLDELSPEVLAVLVANSKSNFHRLEDLCIRAAGFVAHTGDPLSVEAVEAITEAEPVVIGGRYNIRFLWKVVSDHFDVPIRVLESSNKKRPVMDARMALCRLLHEQGMSYSKIAKEVGITKNAAWENSTRWEARRMKSPATDEIWQGLVKELPWRAKEWAERDQFVDVV